MVLKLVMEKKLSVEFEAQIPVARDINGNMLKMSPYGQLYGSWATINTITNG